MLSLGSRDGDRKGPQAVCAGYGDVIDSRNDGDPNCSFRLPLFKRAEGECVQQSKNLGKEVGCRVLPLWKEGIGEYALGHVTTDKFSAYDNDGDLRKALAYDRKELKPIHIRHLQVRNDDVGQCAFERRKATESIAC